MTRKTLILALLLATAAPASAAEPAYTQVPDTFSCDLLGYYVQKAPMHNGFGAEINILDLSDVRELSRTDTALQCAGTGLLSNGSVDAPMEFSLFYRPNSAAKWFYDVRQVQ